MKLGLFTLAASLLLSTTTALAQQKNFTYKFSGQIRTDLFYNSRSNSESVDGLFYMYPKDIRPDANGNDLNAKPDGSLYTMYSRLGLDVTGPKLGNVSTSAKVEVDFRGGGTNYYMVRLRQAYFNLGFGKSSLLVGQTWHPFYGEVAPEILNLNMGAPFQPFSRAPQIRYRFNDRNFQLTFTALWQSQYLSVGPASNAPGSTATEKSQRFIKNSCVPELTLGMDYKHSAWIAGAGVDMTSIVPRTESAYNNETHRVREQITSFSAEAHLKYVQKKWLVAAKTVLGSNFTQGSGVGGYGITSIDQHTGEQEYTPIRISSTWVNVAYGSKWRPALFFGYLKNLGASTPITRILGTGIGDGLDQIVTGSAEMSYNLPHWKFGMEYLLSSAWYGTPDSNAKIKNTHSVVNHRVVLSATFQF